MIATYTVITPKGIASYISLNIKSRWTKQHQVMKYNYEQFMRYIIMQYGTIGIIKYGFIWHMISNKV